MKKTRKSSNEFSRSVESLVLKNNGNLNYIDAVCVRRCGCVCACFAMLCCCMRCLNRNSTTASNMHGRVRARREPTQYIYALSLFERPPLQAVRVRVDVMDV